MSNFLVRDCEFAMGRDLQVVLLEVRQKANQVLIVPHSLNELRSPSFACRSLQAYMTAG